MREPDGSRHLGERAGRPRVEYVPKFGMGRSWRRCSRSSVA